MIPGLNPGETGVYNPAPVYYPIGLKVEGRRAVVVGGGAVGLRKAQALVRAGAEVIVVSKTFDPRFARLPVRRVGRPFEPRDLAGAFVVVCATNDEALNARVWREATRRGRLVNVVDRPALCNFIVPAQVRRGPLTLSISTNGGSPGLSKSLRRELQRFYPNAYGRLVRAIDRHRRRLKAAVPDPKRRARLLKSISSPRVLETMRSRGLEATLKLVDSLARR